MDDIMEQESASSSDESKFYTTVIRDGDNSRAFTVPKRYKNLEFLSAGAQGTVVSADDTVTGRRVAIKKMQQPFVMPMSAKRAYREFVLLASIKHQNIIDMFSAFTPQERVEDFREVYLVMELMNHNLHQVINRLRLDHRTLSFFVYQMLCAINHMHKTGIIHRDLKPSNIVVDERCNLKILDFGLARKTVIDTAMRMSEYVVTRYYRAPEVILGMQYSEKVDIWSVGCILAEMINHRVLFPGRDSVDQLSKIVSVLGTPSDHFIKRLAPSAADYVRSRPPSAARPIEEILPAENFLESTEIPRANLTAAYARDLMQRMLAMDPEERISVADALKHPYVYLWHKDAEVNASPSESRYNQQLDFADHGLGEWKALIFDEVKRFESSHDVFGDKA